MKIAGIISEYNPFHNGHKYHIEQTKKMYGATHICAVMCGNFTQRGDIAIYDKFTRAETAVKNGVDLVVELPTAFALSSAETFALGAVSILNALGNVNILSFGSECGDISRLKEAAGAVEYCSQDKAFFLSLQAGKSYPAALQETIERNYTSDVVETLTLPNNTLAVEYIKALSSTGSFIEPITVKRKGAAHDAYGKTEGFVSASELRRMIRGGISTADFAPEIYDSAKAADLRLLETAILYKLRIMQPSELIKISNIAGGLENSICKAAKAAVSLGELLMLAKSKRYTMARIRRAVMCAFLDITKKDTADPPSYIHILAMNEKGKEILSSADTALPIDTSLAALKKKGAIPKKQTLLEERAGNIYALAFQERRPCGLDYRTKPYISF